MHKLNPRRIILGGLAAGLVMNVIDALTNGLWLAERWKLEADALDPLLMQKMAKWSTIGWVTVDFLTGIVLVWLYAVIRTPLGPGRQTALTAGFVVWLIGHAVYFSYAFMGLFSPALIAASSIGGLVGALAGAFVGGWLYRDE